MAALSWRDSTARTDLWAWNADNRITWLPSDNLLEIVIGSNRVAWFDCATQGARGRLSIRGQVFEEYGLSDIGETQSSSVVFDRAAEKFLIGAYSAGSWRTALEISASGNLALYSLREATGAVDTTATSVFDGEIDLDADGTLAVSAVWENQTVTYNADDQYTFYRVTGLRRVPGTRFMRVSLEPITRPFDR